MFEDTEDFVSKSKSKSKGKGDPKCDWCHGSGEIMHGEMIPCPKCTREGKEKYGWMTEAEVT